MLLTRNKSSSDKRGVFKGKGGSSSRPSSPVHGDSPRAFSDSEDSKPEDEERKKKRKKRGYTFRGAKTLEQPLSSPVYSPPGSPVGSPLRGGGGGGSGSGGGGGGGGGGERERPTSPPARLKRRTTSLWLLGPSKKGKEKEVESLSPGGMFVFSSFFYYTLFDCFFLSFSLSFFPSTTPLIFSLSNPFPPLTEKRKNYGV